MRDPRRGLGPAISEIAEQTAKSIPREDSEQETDSHISDPAETIDRIRKRSKRSKRATKQREQEQEQEQEVQSIVWYALIGLAAVWFIKQK